MAIKWITVKHDKTGHTHRVPSRPAALRGLARRGWHPVKEETTGKAAKAASTKES